MGRFSRESGAPSGGRGLVTAALTGALVAVPMAGARLALSRAVQRVIHPARVLPDEAALAPAVDALGGEVVRLRSRDGLRLAGRWLPSDAPVEVGSRAGEAGTPGNPPPDSTVVWRPDPGEAIVLLHGYSGSVSPDIVEYAPFLRRTAGILAIDFRGHGGSDDGPTTFGLLEIEDVAGALAWLGERGVRRVALFGTSMGGITAIAASVVLGDGRLASADLDPFAPISPAPPPRPEIVAVVGDSVSPRLEVVIRNRMRGPARGLVARRILDAMTARLGDDPRSVEPLRVVGLLEQVPLMLIHGGQDQTVPAEAAAELVEAARRAGVAVEAWTVDAADHSLAHRVAGEAYEARVTAFVRAALLEARERGAILAAPAQAIPASEA